MCCPGGFSRNTWGQASAKQHRLRNPGLLCTFNDKTKMRQFMAKLVLFFNLQHLVFSAPLVKQVVVPYQMLQVLSNL